MKISVSYLSSIYNREDTVKKINCTSADYLHVDVMDGVFVKEKNDDLDRFIEEMKLSKKDLDIHLMVKYPANYIDAFKLLNPKRITFHIELDNNLDDYIELLKFYKIEIGIAINPDTKIDKLFSYLDRIDEVLVMGVNPGRGGQEYIDDVTEKIKKLKKIKDENNYKFDISLDGGVNKLVALKVAKYLDILVSGSYICKHEDYEERVIELKNII